MDDLNDKIVSQFDAFSSDYDKNRKYLIPAMDLFYGAGVDFLAYGDGAPCVLDVGAGTGIYTHFLFNRYPDAMVTLIDMSENMIDIARRKFAGNDNVSYICEDYLTHDFGGEKFDIIISALSIHHFDTQAKRTLYRKLYDLLNHGGEFLNADIVNSGESFVNQRYDAQWIEFVKGNIGEDDEMLDRFLKSKDIDNPSSTAKQLKWLDEAGFAVTDCVFKYFNFAVMYGRKP